MTTLHDKTILITGSTGGFGREFATQLYAKGNRLILTDLDSVKLEEQANALDSSGGSGDIVGVFASDLSTVEGADALFEQVQSMAVDVLINNAGLGLFGRHDEVPNAEWERMMQVNLLAPMRLCAAFTPQMIERGGGCIINVASLASWVADTGLTAYAASKFGLRGFSETLATELAPHNIQVSVVCPYFSRTPILDSPRYGSLSERNGDALDENGITEPADVIAEAIAQVESGTQQIMPDRTAKIVYRLKRYAPSLLGLLMGRFSKVNG